MPELDDILTARHDEFEQDLCQLLQIPSVSADSAYKPHMQQAADWVAGQFRTMGMKTEVLATAGHPVVLAESEPVPEAPVVLVYGHYDVQPPDPLELWKTPPFEPTVRDGNVYARGATDDKGQMLTHVKSAQALIEASGKLPLQLKFLIEGEEEIGSPSLVPFVVAHRDRLACDCVVISDSSQFGPGQPAITYGLRGIAYYELRLFGSQRDLHSGSFGGAVLNPANVLTEMLGTLRGPDGKVALTGFYDDVVPLTDREREEFRRLPFDDARFARSLGVDALGGEAGYSTLERRWARPTLDINGLASGYQGEGAKTVLPASAVAKFSFRLVPNQDPQKLTQALEARLRQLCPAGIRMELIDFHGAPGVVVPLDSPFVAAAERAIEKGFGCRPVFIREGGSIPVVATFREQLGVDTLLLGWGLDDDNTHSPNEKFCLADYHRGIRSSAHLWQEISQINK